MKIKILIAIAWFLILYLIAFFLGGRLLQTVSAFLGVEDTQWAAILIFWLPILLIFTE